MNKFISKNEFASQYGLELHTVSNWMKRHWSRDFHYTVIGRTTMIHIQRVENWLDQNFRPSEVSAKGNESNSRRKEVRKAAQREEIKKVISKGQH